MDSQPDKYITKLAKWKFKRAGDEAPTKSGWYSLYPREIYHAFIGELLEGEGWVTNEWEREAREWLRDLEKIGKERQ